MLTVLEKCGINAALIKFFKAKGLSVKKRITPFPSFMRSPSEEWFSSITDRFTPPLEPSEKKAMIANPYIFSHKVAEGATLLSEISGVLHEALSICKKKLSGGEAIAALLSINHIFISCLHLNYLKFDRHLEYHDYPESPVGHYWQKFNALCLSAATKLPKEEREKWAREKMLQILGGRTGMNKTSEYTVACANIRSAIVREGTSTADVRSTLNHIHNTSALLYGEISVYCDYFHRSPTEFISDCITMGDSDPEHFLRVACEASARAVEEVKSNLSKSEVEDLDRIRDIIGAFLLAQETEGFIFSGITPHGHFRVVDTPFDAIGTLSELLQKDWSYVQPQHRKELEDVLKNTDPPSRMIASTRLASDLENCLITSVQELLYEELDRWL